MLDNYGHMIVHQRFAIAVNRHNDSGNFPDVWLVEQKLFPKIVVLSTSILSLANIPSTGKQKAYEYISSTQTMNSKQGPNTSTMHHN